MSLWLNFEGSADEKLRKYTYSSLNTPRLIIQLFLTVLFSLLKWLSSPCETYFIYLANAKSSNQAVAPMIQKVTNFPLSLWRGQASMMCCIICSSPQAHSGLGLLSQLETDQAGDLFTGVRHQVTGGWGGLVPPFWARKLTKQVASGLHLCHRSFEMSLRACFSLSLLKEGKWSAFILQPPSVPRSAWGN